MWTFENQARSEGYAHIAGVDEAGRGPLAGPVVAAAVILSGSCDVSGITDSKLLSARARERAYERILGQALAVGVGVVDVRTIDRINILKATHEAMRLALDDMGAVFDFILVDGLAVPDLPAPSKAIVRGRFGRAYLSGPRR